MHVCATASLRQPNLPGTSWKNEETGAGHCQLPGLISTESAVWGCAHLHNHCQELMVVLAPIAARKHISAKKYRGPNC